MSGRASKSKKSLEVSEREIHSNNLIAVFRLAIKTLIDLFFVHKLTEHSAEILNFVTIFENLMSFGLRHSKGTHWGYVKNCCKSSANIDHVMTVNRMENVITDSGRLRVWIRLCLMEKRFSEYFKILYDDHTRLLKFYDDHSVFMVESAMAVVYNDLIGLNAIDVNFYMKNQDFDNGLRVVDFTPYLNFQQCPESAILDLPGAERLESDVPSASVDHVQQTAYLEEIVKNRDSQIEVLKQREQDLVKTLEAYKLKMKQERTNYEDVIIELQKSVNTPNGNNGINGVIRRISSGSKHATVVAMDEVNLADSGIHAPVSAATRTFETL